MLLMNQHTKSDLDFCFSLVDSDGNPGASFTQFMGFGLEKPGLTLSLYDDDNCYTRVWATNEDAVCQVLPEGVSLANIKVSGMKPDVCQSRKPK
jgi:hypothetical protein